MLESLILPIVLSAIALFFMSFLSWMVLGLHKNDWQKVPQEDELLTTLRSFNLPPGSYMFPYCAHGSPEMKSPEFQKKYMDGPRGSITLMPIANMGMMLGMTFIYFLVVSFFLAYLAGVAFPAGASFESVFRFVFIAALMTFLAAMVQHTIWFRVRITGHVIESIFYAAIVAGILAWRWPQG